MIGYETATAAPDAGGYAAVAGELSEVGR